MKHFLLAVAVLYGLNVYAGDWKENPEIGKLFNGAEVNGTFVLYDVAAQTYTGHDQARAGTRFVPASTFKIPNTLIGLSVGAVKSVDEVLPYGGQRQQIKAWEKDMSLRDAIVISNVPIYQELARRIGIERMQENVARLDYGNKETGSAVDRFWLTGPLKISAIEQTRFLAKLAKDELPFSQAVQNSTREIVLLETGENWKLFGKTGWENAPGNGIGWWVGWVQKGDRIYAFALNLDITKPPDAAKRVELGKACLHLLQVL